MAERTILFCACAFGDGLPPDRRREALAGMLAAGVEPLLVRDLCEAVARRDPLLATVAGAPDPVIVACRPRAVRSLFLAAGAPLPATATVVDLRAEGAPVAEAFSAAEVGEAHRRRADERLGALPPVAEDDWKPWFPVLDRDRCDDCGACRNFCIFGVYGGSTPVEAENPAACKDRCPACARVCPQAAIIFPRHGASPIDGGDGPAGEPVQVDLQAMMAGDVEGLLRRRGRFSGQVPADCDCLERAEVLRQLGVPASVLASVADELAKKVRP